MISLKKVLPVLAILLSIGGFAQNTDEKAIQKVMDDQVYYWNKGDLDNFVKGYWQADSVMFIGKNGIVYGYDNTLERYRKSYSDTVQMGKLKFTILHLKQLSPEYYFLVGKFHLTRSVGDLSGHFTLLFRKINGEWQIIADHSS
ncbi:MAG: nuclear transport factor 2 family protein [Chitinophagaceae bacterium]|nr:nuclear transport factor 2 family protein [Chitinophagaceae bacterium]MCW5925784.1 nuclear transport factor 2 family protein [Chitinophagaceae bacterium]